MRELKEGSLSQKILIALADLAKISGYIVFWNYREIRKITGLGPLYKNAWASFSNNRSTPKYFTNLKKGNFIKETREGKNRKIEITEKGKREIIKYKIKLKVEKPNWNKKWFAIAWDIPEISRKDRDYLREKLKWIGFKEMQKSLWIFPYDIREELKELVELYKKDILGNIKFLVIEKIEDDSNLLKYFNL